MPDAQFRSTNGYGSGIFPEHQVGIGKTCTVEPDVTLTITMKVDREKLKQVINAITDLTVDLEGINHFEMETE
jgi:hypothetical protein